MPWVVDTHPKRLLAVILLGEKGMVIFLHANFVVGKVGISASLAKDAGR